MEEIGCDDIVGPIPVIEVVFAGALWIEPPGTGDFRPVVEAD